HFSITLNKRENKPNTMTSRSELHDLLCCPKCKKGVILKESEKKIICSQCKMFFPIDSGIPLMDPDEARVL
ncbi:Trm112 family protein, partial [Verrucomicrobiota bacterium]